MVEQVNCTNHRDINVCLGAAVSVRAGGRCSLDLRDGSGSVAWSVDYRPASGMKHVGCAATDGEKEMERRKSRVEQRRRGKVAAAHRGKLQM